MAFKKRDINDYRAIILLVVTILPVIASTNINCHGRPFHCVNSTHFMICVDIGGGYSSTIDHLVIPCPPTTICMEHNRFECEFPPATPAPTLGMLHASTTSIGILSTTKTQNVVTTDPPAPTTNTLIYGNLNSINSTLNIQAIENITAKNNITERSIATFANTSKYPNTENVQLTSPTPKDNTTKENHTIADSINKLTTVGTYVSGVVSNTTHVNNKPTDTIKLEITTEPAAIVANTQIINSIGINNNTKNISSSSAYSQNFSDTAQETTTPSSYTKFAKEQVTTNMGTEFPVYSVSMSQATTETPTRSTETQKNKDGKGIVTSVQESSSLNILNTNKPTSSASQPMLTGLQSSTSSTVAIRQGSIQNKLTSSDVSTVTPMLSVSTVANKYPTSINPVTTASYSNDIITGNASSSTTSAIKSSNINTYNVTLTTDAVTITIPDSGNTFSNFHKIKDGKGVETTVQGFFIFNVTDTGKSKTSVTELVKTDPPSSSSSRVDIGSYTQSTLTTFLSTDSTMASAGTVTEKYPNSVHSIINASSSNDTIPNNTSLSTAEKLHSNNASKSTEAFTKQPPLNVGTDGSLFSQHVNHNTTDNHLIDVTTESITVSGQNVSSALQENSTTASDAHTFSLPPTTKMVTKTSSGSTDSTMTSAGTVTENYQNSAHYIINASSTNNTIASNAFSSTVDLTNETLHGNNTLKSAEPFTKQPVFSVGTEGSLSSHHVIHTFTGSHLIDVTTESITVNSQNISSVLQDNATTTSEAHTFNVPLTTKMVTNLMISPVSTDSTMASVGTVTEIYPNSVHPLINDSSTNNAIESKTLSSTVDSTPDASTKQPLFDIGTEGSLSSHHVIHNNTDSNLIDVTTESIIGNGQNVSSTLQDNATTSFDAHTFNVPLTTKTVTNLMISPVSTDSIMTTAGTVTENYNNSVHSITNASSTNIIIASNTSSSTVDSTAPKLYNKNTSKSTEDFTKQPLLNVGTEGSLSSHYVIHNSTDSHLIDVTTESITFNGQNFSSVLQDNATTTSDANTFNGPITTKMVTNLMTFPVSTESTITPVGTVKEKYPNSVHSIINVSSTNNAIANNTSSSTVDSTTEKLHSNNTSKSTESYTKQPLLNGGTEGSLSSRYVIHNSTDSYLIDVTTQSITGNGQNVSRVLKENATTTSEAHTFNVPLTTKMVTNLMMSPVSTDSKMASVGTVTEIYPNSVHPLINDSSTNNAMASKTLSSTVDSTPNASTKQPLFNVGTEGSLSSHHVIHNNTDSNLIDVTTESMIGNGQNFSSALQDNATTSFDAQTFIVPLTTKTVTNLMISPVSTDSIMTSAGTVTENYTNSVHFITNTSSTKIIIASNRSSSTVDSTAPKLHSKNTSKSTEDFTKQPVLNVGTEGSLYSHYVIHNSTDSHLIDVTTESITFNGQNFSSVLQDNATTTSDANTFNGPITPKLVTNLMMFPVSTESTITPVGTVKDMFPNSVHSIINASSTNNAIASNTSSSTVDSTTEKLHSNNTSKRTEASTKQPLLNSGTEGSLTSHYVIYNSTDSHLIDVTTESIIVNGQNFSSALQENATTTFDARTYNVSLTTKIVTNLMTYPVRTDSTISSVGTGAEKYSNSVHSITNASSTNNSIASNTSSSTAGKLNNNDTTLSTQASTIRPLLDIGTEGSVTSHHINHNITSGKFIEVTTEYTSPIPVTGQNISNGLQGTVTMSSYTNTVTGPISTKMVAELTTSPVSIDSLMVSMNTVGENYPTSVHSVINATSTNNTNGSNQSSLITESTTSYTKSPILDVATEGRQSGTSPVIGPILTSSQPSTSSILDIGLIYTQSDLTVTPISTEKSILSVSTVAETYSAALNSVKNTNTTNNTSLSNTSLPTVDSTIEQLYNINTSKSTETSTKQSILNVGARGSLPSYNITQHIMDSNFTDVTTDYVSSMPVNSQNFPKETAATSSNRNTFNGSLTSNIVTVTISAIANISTDSYIKEGGKGVDTSTHGPAYNRLTIINSGPAVTDTQFSTSYAANTESVTKQSKTDTSHLISNISTLVTTVTVTYPASINVDTGSNASFNTITNKTSSATTEISATKLSSNIFKTTQASEITIGAKQPDVGTERGWKTQNTADSIGGHIINATTENILTIPIDGLISSNTDTTTTSSNLNNSSGTFSTNLVTVPTTNAANTFSDTLVTQRSNETLSTIQAKSTFNITNKVKPTSSVTQFIMTGYTQPSTPSVRSVESISEQSNLTVSVVSTESSFPLISTVADKYPNFNNINISENKVQLATTDTVTRISTHDKISKTTEAYIKTQYIGTGTDYSASSYSNYNNTENTSTTHSTGRNFSNTLNGLAPTTTISDSNTLKEQLTTSITLAVTTPTVKRSTDINVSQIRNGTVTPIQKGSTFNSFEVVKSITTVTEPILTQNSQSTIPTKGQNISHPLQDTATTRFFSNTFDVSHTINVVTEAYKDTTNRTTDVLANQIENRVGTKVHGTTKVNIADNVKPSSSVTKQIPSNSSILTTVAVEGTTSPVTTDSIILSVSTGIEYSTSLHFNVSSNVTNNNNKILNTTHITIKQPEPNGGTQNSLETSNTTDASTLAIVTTHSETYSNQLLDTTTPSSNSNTFIASHTTDMSLVTTMPNANRPTDTQVTQNWDTRTQGNSTLNSSDTVKFTSPATVVTLMRDPQSNTSSIPIEIPISTDSTTLSLNMVAENYSTLTYLDMSANASNNAVINASSTISDVINGNIENNNISNTTRAYTINPTAAIDSLSSHIITDVLSGNAIDINSGNSTAHQDGQNYSHNTLPVEATTSSYSNHFDGQITTKIIAGGITDTANLSSVTFGNQNWDGVLTTAQNSSTLNNSDSIQTASSTTVVILAGDSQSSTSVTDKKYFISISPTTEKYSTAITFDIGDNIKNNTLATKSVTSYSSIEKSNTTSQTTKPYRSLQDVRTDSRLTSYNLTNSTLQGNKYSNNSLPNAKSSGNEPKTSMTSASRFVNNGTTTKPTLSSSQNYTKNINTDTVSNLNQGQTTPMPFGLKDINVSTVYAVELKSLHLLENVTAAQMYNIGTTEPDNTKTSGNKTTENIATITALVTEQAISSTQSNLENSANSFPSINSNNSNDILNQSHPAANILSSTKSYPTYNSERSTKIPNHLYSSYSDSYLTPITESQLPILTSLISRPTSEDHSVVRNAADTTTVINDISNHSQNKTRSNVSDTSSANNHMNSDHDISHQHNVILETKSNKTVNQAVTNEHLRKQMPNNVYQPNSLTPRNPQSVNANNGNANNIGSFHCPHHRRGRYADNDDCRKFYICIENQQPILGVCPVNTVFSEINKQCTKNLSHCIRNNQFQCTSEGRFGDYLKDSVYYICVKNGAHALVRFKLQCQSGYYLNKTEVRCMGTTDSTSESKSVDNDSSKRSSDSTKTKSQESVESIGTHEEFRCENEGKFGDPNDCRRYYVCSKRSKSGFRRKKKMCDSDEVFHKDKKKCVTAESDEC